METGHVSVPNPEDAQRIFLTKSPFSLNGGIGYRQKLIPYVKNSPSSTCEDQLDAMRDSNCCKGWKEMEMEYMSYTTMVGFFQFLVFRRISDVRLDSINHDPDFFRLSSSTEVVQW